VELHLGRDVLVPDLSGWRRERLPRCPSGPFVELAPDWYRGQRAPYALAISGVKPRPGPSPAPPPVPEEAPSSPAQFAFRFVAGSLAGALFIPVAVALTLRDRAAAKRAR